MSYKLSICVFISNTFDGAFCFFEGMATLLPYASEFIVLDLGSTDGTLEYLQEISDCNKKVKLLQGRFDKIDANVFATLANDLIAECQYNNILYYQSDEIWHDDLLGVMEKVFIDGIFDLSFWRIQYRENFQKVKWFPHIVHRVGQKSNFHFVGDGMNTNRIFDAKICSTYGGEWFPKWYDEFKDKEGQLPVNEMILDVSMVGAFLENIPIRRQLHAPFWHEEPHIENKPANEWMAIERENPNWYKVTTPFNIPTIMHYHLGRPKYELRPDLLEAIKEDRTYIPRSNSFPIWR